jgi:ABC-type antimicrobial peptide transport system, ATPase component
MIFQDPNSSLNPQLRVGRILEAPLRLNTDLTEEERANTVIDTLRMVGLLPEHALFYPQMISLGQKQRVALARALILDPKIIVADEAFSMLDVSMRSQIVNLLLKLQERLGLSYVVVANDLGLVRHISDKVLIMHQGEVVESGLTSEVFANPQHDVTKRLIQNHGHEYRL